MDIQECYQVLGLPTTASEIEVKKAYLKLAKKNNPDLFVDATAKEIATEKFIQINEAYQVINSSQKTTFGETNNNQAKLLYNFGVYSAEIEDFEEANQYFSQAIKLDPSFAKAYFYRGIILEKQGFNFRAESDFNKYYELKTGYPIKSTNPNYKRNKTNYQKVQFKKPFKLFTPVKIIIGIILMAIIPLSFSDNKNMLFINSIAKTIESQNLSDEQLNDIKIIFNYYGGRRRAIETGLAFCQYLEDKISLNNSDEEMKIDGIPMANIFSVMFMSEEIGKEFVGGSIPSNEADLIREIGMAINISSITYLCPEYIDLYKIRED